MSKGLISDGVSASGVAKPLVDEAILQGWGELAARVSIAPASACQSTAATAMRFGTYSLSQVHGTIVARARRIMMITP